MITEKKYNNEILYSYKETIDNLNKEISQLKSQIEKLKKENNELKSKLNTRKNNKSGISRNSSVEDEIVIINKETTFSKGILEEPNEFNNYGEINNKYEIK